MGEDKSTHILEMRRQRVVWVRQMTMHENKSTHFLETRRRRGCEYEKRECMRMSKHTSYRYRGKGVSVQRMQTRKDENPHQLDTKT